jgi:hypothetical protein
MFAATAVAQTATPAPASAPDAKTKQEMVKSTTEAAQGPASLRTSEKSAKAASEKGTAKALTDKSAKQQAVKSTTEAAQSPTSLKTSEKSAKAATEKGTPRKAKPKPQIDSPALKEAAKP